MERLIHNIERYYKTKNEEYKEIIKELCRAKETTEKASNSTGFPAFSALSSEDEIKYEIEDKLTNREHIKNKKFGHFGKFKGEHILRLYEDIRKFHTLFKSKGIDVTYNKILTAFSDIIDKEECEDIQNNIFEEINSNVVNKGSEHEIIRNFLEYKLATNKKVSLSDYSTNLLRIILGESCKKDLPQLLSKFGFQYDQYTDKLEAHCNEIIDLMKNEAVQNKNQIQEQIPEQELESFERDLNSNYGDLPKEINQNNFRDKANDKSYSDCIPEQEKDNKTLIDKYEEDYQSALLAIDNEVKELIKQKKEMKALLLFNEKCSIIIETHEALHNLYSIIYKNQGVLKRFNSERLRQLGFEPKPTRELLQCLEGFDATEEEIEKFVLMDLKSIGFTKKHWYIKNSVLNEIEYMIEALRILVEPEFIPLDADSEDELDEDTPNRYVPSSVKLAVWRRDKGKCVQCGSKEKLEYDHIIPISKGGSNTERNIQLLCEKCNRKKSASIQ